MKKRTWFLFVCALWLVTTPGCGIILQTSNPTPPPEDDGAIFSIPGSIMLR